MFYRKRIEKLEYELAKLRFELKNPCIYKLGLIKLGKDKGTFINSIDIIESDVENEFYYLIEGLTKDGERKTARQYQESYFLNKINKTHE
jgi:hypothetical protein